jgi:hypothetical protein
MTTPAQLETETTLRTAVERYDELRARDSMAEEGSPQSLTKAEVLELLALSEVIARKAVYGRQLAVRTARKVGASWADIGRALDTSRQAAWETHTRWIEGQAHQYEDSGYIGLSEDDTQAARKLAGHLRDT